MHGTEQILQETRKLLILFFFFLTSKVVPVVKNPPANTGDIRNMGSTPGLGRSPGGGHGNSLQYSCLENPIDRGAWQATVLRVAQSQTQLKWLSRNWHWYEEGLLFANRGLSDGKEILLERPHPQFCLNDLHSSVLLFSRALLLWPMS